MNLFKRYMGDFIVVFGINDLAELAWYYLKTDSNNIVRAFTVNREFIPESKTYRPRGSNFDFPVVVFEDLEQLYPPNKYKLFAPVIDNKLREKIYLEGLKRGYRFISYISSKATVLTEDIGKNCFILENNVIQPYTKIGNNVICWSGNHLGHHGEVENNVFFTSHVVMSGHCKIKKGAYLGVNSTIRDGVTIGENSVVGMGSLVTKNIPDNETWIGSPAKKK